VPKIEDEFDPREEILYALRVLFRPDQVIELRVPNCPRNNSTTSGYFDDADALADFALQLSGGCSGVYVTLNEINPALLARMKNRAEAWARQSTSDKDVLRRRWLPLDFDPVRPSGISSTDEEHEAALERAEKCRLWLAEQRWPGPVVASSGNGAHLLYRIDLPNDEDSKALVAGCLKTIADKFSDETVKVDESVGNAARIWKLYGTLAKKGDPTEDRPHRYASLLDSPEEPVPVTVEQLEALAALAPKPETPSPSANGHPRLDIPRWLKDQGVQFRVKEGTGSDLRTRFIITCPFDPNHADAAVMQAPNGQLSAKCFHASCDGNGWKEFKAQIGAPAPDHYDLPQRKRAQKNGRGTRPRRRSSPDEADAAEGRVTVVLGTDEHRVTAEAEAVLATKARDLYQRGRQLVQILSHRDEGKKPKERIRRADSAPVVRPLPTAILREELSRYVEFVALRKGRLQPAHVPGYAVSAINARGVWRGLPDLEVVVSHPVLLPDGSILADPGYHRESGLFLWLPEGLEVSVPEAPTLADAVRARDELLDVVQDFPFKSDPHKSAWIASVLTPLARFTFEGVAPLFVADGNVAGVGKGLLFDTSFLIVSGRRAAVAGYTNDTEELRKAITTVAVEGDEMVLFDNVTGAFGNAVLDRALTATHWKDRILGGNTQYDGPLTVTWYVTANNLNVMGDTGRRLLPIRLESNMERPEERGNFKYPDLRAHVLKERGRLLSACLTILRAYCLAGRPQQRPLMPWGSFEGWSALIRGAVTWVLMPDPADTREDLRIGSCPETEALNTLYAGIAQCDPKGHGLTVAALIERTEFAGQDTTAQALKDALLLLCPNRGKPDTLNAQAIGMKLHHLRNRVVGGRRLERVGTRSHAAAVRWRVVDIGGLGGTKGE
jgi:hypothetical protein